MLFRSFLFPASFLYHSSYCIIYSVFMSAIFCWLLCSLLPVSWGGE
nr:MAG TPA: hypothetical protein [Caudoviricetes sp.]DAX45008.1 MAG TPA: hypothetical protein [Caudoviricetes sp.]